MPSAPQPKLRPLPARLWRVHRNEYGPLNPPVRRGRVRLAWSRFDQTSRVTLYGAEQRFGAYLESLAYARHIPLDLTGLFDDPDPEPVEQQWETLGHMRPGGVARQWRADRSITDFRRRASSGSVIDLADSATIAHLRVVRRQWHPGKKIPPPGAIDLSLLTGSKRSITSAIARYFAQLTLADGTQPIGLRYPSRHGGEQVCYALWVDLHRYPAGESVADAVRNEYEDITSTPIELHDADLKAAATSLRVRLF